MTLMPVNLVKTMNMLEAQQQTNFILINFHRTNLQKGREWLRVNALDAAGNILELSATYFVKFRVWEQLKDPDNEWKMSQKGEIKFKIVLK